MCIWWPWKLFWPIVTTIICMQCHNWPADENGCQMNGGYTWAWRPRDARGKAAGVQNHFPVVQSFSKPGVLSFEQHGICWKQENKQCCTESRHVGEIRLLQGEVFCRDLKTPWAGWRSVAGPRRRKRDGNDVVKGRREDEIWASFERGRGKCLGWPWWCQQQAGRRIHIHIFIIIIVCRYILWWYSAESYKAESLPEARPVLFGLSTNNPSARASRRSPTQWRLSWRPRWFDAFKEIESQDFVTSINQTNIERIVVLAYDMRRN